VNYKTITSSMFNSLRSRNCWFYLLFDVILALLVLLDVVPLLLVVVLVVLFGCAPPIIEVMAAAKAAVKLGSAAMAAVAAVTVSARCGGGLWDWLLSWEGSASWDIWRPENLDWLYSAWPNIWGSNEAEELAKFWGTPGKGIWNWFGGFGNCSGFGDWVKSNVTVGNGADAEIVAMLEEQGRSVLVRKFAFIRPSALDMDPESSILAAEEVVCAIAIAAGGKGWLWFPSYVVISIVRSSAHLCTCLHINNETDLVSNFIQH